MERGRRKREKDEVIMLLKEMRQRRGGETVSESS